MNLKFENEERLAGRLAIETRRLRRTMEGADAVPESSVQLVCGIARQCRARLAEARDLEELRRLILRIGLVE